MSADNQKDEKSPFELGIASYWRARRNGETESHAIELAVSDALDARESPGGQQSCPKCGALPCDQIK